MREPAEGGVRKICLTNGSAQTTSAFLQRTGLEAYIERVVSPAEVKSWKPPARVYHHGRTRRARTPGGAGRGVCLGLPRRQAGGADHRMGEPAGGPLRGLFIPADVTGTDLVEVAHRLLALPPAS